MLTRVLVLQENLSFHVLPAMGKDTSPDMRMEKPSVAHGGGFPISPWSFIAQTRVEAEEHRMEGGRREAEPIVSQKGPNQ